MAGVRHSLAVASRYLVGRASLGDGGGVGRRARFLAVLQLAHFVQLLVASAAVAITESGRSARIIPAVLLGTALIVLVSYALGRTNRIRAASWLYVATNLALGTVIVLLVGPAPEVVPFASVAYLVPALLVANALTSAPGTLVAGLTSLAAIVVAARYVFPAAWNDDVRRGSIFVLVSLGLVVVFGVHRDRVEADRSAELRLRNEELETLRQTLELRVSDRTAELAARNIEMKLVLDNVGQGLFVVDRAGSLSSEPSAALIGWFGRPNENESFAAYLGRSEPRFAEAAALAWDQVVDDLIPLEAALDQLPTRLSTNGLDYSVGVRPIGADPVSHFLIVVTDVTSEVERGRMHRDRRELHALFEHMTGDRSQLVEFVDEASALVAGISSPRDLRARKRDLHTLKGNALSFGLESVAEICHDLESLLADDPELTNAAKFAPLEQRWASLTVDIERMLGERRRSIEISLEQHAALDHAVRAGATRGVLVEMLQKLRLDPVGPRLERLAEQARLLAVRLGKMIVVRVSDDGTRVEPGKWAPVWAALVHAVRNAVDHGIETPEERVALGKSECGLISLRVMTSSAGLSIEVEDDGRGLDWEEVRRRAPPGSRTETHEELLALLFEGGVTTAAQVTDVSGRGAGMGALHAVVSGLGGELGLVSLPGKGASLRLSFASERLAVGGPGQDVRRDGVQPCAIGELEFLPAPPRPLRQSTSSAPSSS